MSLMADEDMRDELARLVLMQILSDSEISTAEDREGLAEIAYGVANAMMKARSKRG